MTKSEFLSQLRRAIMGSGSARLAQLATRSAQVFIAGSGNADIEPSDAADIFKHLRTASKGIVAVQLWTMMTSAGLFENDTQREAGVLEVRERWTRGRQPLRD